LRLSIGSGKLSAAGDSLRQPDLGFGLFDEIASARQLLII
jgi:hypothetical protein